MPTAITGRQFRSTKGRGPYGYLGKAPVWPHHVEWQIITGSEMIPLQLFCEHAECCLRRMRFLDSESSLFAWRGAQKVRAENAVARHKRDFILSSPFWILNSGSYS